MSAPCFWYVNEEKVTAICVTCQQEHKIEGWYWPGDEKGYGDYDLDCFLCKTTIHKREDETQTTI
jgi:hypothetical protein